MLLNYFLAILVLAFSFAGTVLMSGTALNALLDLPSILIMVLFPFVYQCLLFGVSKVKLAFTTGFRKDATMEQVTKAQLFFKSYGKIIWITAFVVVLMATVNMLRNLDNRNMIGPNFAMALISLLYAGLMHLVIIIPNSVFLKNRLAELNIDI